ncbi:MAG: pyridoxine 5'-phosphate synthase [Xanthobacteraceae bacterium]|nr:pyridoxine 5'-phosphate synthase [Xanthobacteraceae bacterium]
MSDLPQLRLGVNIDHVATVRNARGGRHPDPVRAALAAIEAGADGITAHLREDRRHIRDERKSGEAKTPNFQSGRGGGGGGGRGRGGGPPAPRLRGPGARGGPPQGGGAPAPAPRARAAAGGGGGGGGALPLFPPPPPPPPKATTALRAPVIEIHTGAWCDAAADGHAAEAAAEFARIRDAARLARRAGLEVHAGHGLDFGTAEAIAALPEVVELNIGHFLVGEAIFSGLGPAVRTMRAAMDKGRARA